MTIQEEKSYKELELLEERYPVLKAVHAEIEKAYLLMRDSFVKGGKLLLCGNGGSSADCDHIVGELMKAFCRSFTGRRQNILQSTWSRGFRPFHSAHKPPCIQPIATTKTRRFFMHSAF